MAASKVKGITVEIGGDTTKLGKALKDSESKSKNLKQELKSVNNLLKADPGNKTLLGQKYDILKQSVEAAKEKLEKLRDVQDQVKKKFENGEISADTYRSFEREIEATEQKLKSLTAAQKEFGTVNSQVMANAGKKMQEVGDKISNVGTGMTTHVTAPIVALGTASVAAFNEVDAGLDIIEQKTGATGEALEEMNQIAKDLATEIPTDFETAGAAVGEVNTRYGLTGQALDDLSSKFIKFSQLNDTDVSTSVDNVSAVMNAFNLDASKAGSLLDALNATGQATGISVDTLATALSSNAAQLKKMGLTAQQAAGFMGMVEMSGLDTSVAMMGLKTAMKNATKDGKTLDTELANFTETIKSSSSETEKLQAAYDLFGSKAGAAIYNACATGKLSLDGLTSSLGDFEGSVETTFSETIDPVDQFTTTMNSLKVAGAEIGNSLMTVLAPVLEQLSHKLKTFSEWWQSLSEPTQQLVINIALIAAAIGPLLITIGKVVSAIGTIQTAIGALTGVIPALSSIASVVTGTLVPAFGALFAFVIANPIVLAIAAIVAAIVAFAVVCKERFGSISAGLQAFRDSVDEVLFPVFNFFQKIFNFIKNNWQGLLLLIVNPFAGAFKLLYDNCESFRNKVNSILDNIKTKFTEFGTKVGTAVSNAFKAVMNAVVTIVEKKINGWISLINAATGIINKLPGVSIGKITPVALPRLRTGGVLEEGSAIVAEAGSPEMITMQNGKAVVRPLTESNKAHVVNAGNASGGNEIVLYSYLQLDGKTVAKKIQHYSDMEAGNTLNRYRRGLPTV